MSLVFRENAKNCQNHGLIEGAVMGRHVYSARWNWSWLLCKLPEICNTQKIICLSFIDCSQFKFFRELRWKKILTVPLWGPPTGPLTIRFRPPNLCYVKRPQLSHIKKLDPWPLVQTPHPGCVARGAGCSSTQATCENKHLAKLNRIIGAIY